MPVLKQTRSPPASSPVPEAGTPVLAMQPLASNEKPADCRFQIAPRRRAPTSAKDPVSIAQGNGPRHASNQLAASGAKAGLFPAPTTSVVKQTCAGAFAKRTDSAYTQ